MFSAPGKGASRGFSIFISEGLAFKSVDVCADKKGRYIIVSGFIQIRKYVFVNIYGPNSGQTGLLGGDFNIVLYRIQR